ncbi:unnamed protein product [Acanthoscelides obtectus]|uniref:Uncharacterized protein n=1 Tax=Acanthoscelides obtectus TaxID=200917 RepID=A0A9P0L6C3_ACAOB|nr:unnamed protein product [Acanthoscelides obtectus]CAK1649723.1 hypothetical protein AOBTE_LOCUS16380 [Acanthoscelides obtectus]
MPIRTPLYNLDVNAREFMPRCDWSRDSRQCSGSSSDSEESFDTEVSLSSSSSEPYAQVHYNQHYIVKPTSGPYLERTCSRCGKPYITDKEYITMERYCYHWGR